MRPVAFATRRTDSPTNVSAPVLPVESAVTVPQYDGMPVTKRLPASAPGVEQSICTVTLVVEPAAMAKPVAEP